MEIIVMTKEQADELIEHMSESIPILSERDKQNIITEWKRKGHIENN